MADSDQPQIEKSFYDRMFSYWKNNKTIAISVFIVVVVIALIKAYTEVAVFVQKINSTADRIAEFNRLVQPIYFEERFANLLDGQQDRIAQMIKDIKAINPPKIIIKSHTSRVAPAPNAAISWTRGEYIRTWFSDEGIDFKKMVIVPLGGFLDKGLDKGYEQRVEIELSK